VNASLVVQFVFSKIIMKAETSIYFLRFNTGGGILVHSYLARASLLTG